MALICKNGVKVRVRLELGLGIGLESGLGLGSRLEFWLAFHDVQIRAIFLQIRAICTHRA